MYGLEIGPGSLSQNLWELFREIQRREGRTFSDILRRKPEVMSANCDLGAYVSERDKRIYVKEIGKAKISRDSVIRSPISLGGGNGGRQIKDTGILCNEANSSRVNLLLVIPEEMKRPVVAYNTFKPMIWLDELMQRYNKQLSVDIVSNRKLLGTECGYHGANKKIVAQIETELLASIQPETEYNIEDMLGHHKFFTIGMDTFAPKQRLPENIDAIISGVIKAKDPGNSWLDPKDMLKDELKVKEIAINVGLPRRIYRGMERYGLLDQLENRAREVLGGIDDDPTIWERGEESKNEGCYIRIGIFPGRFREIRLVSRYVLDPGDIHECMNKKAHRVLENNEVLKRVGQQLCEEVPNYGGEQK